MKKTYCNPLRVVDYPRGTSLNSDCDAEDHRSLADPTVILYKDRYYMYPSYGMAWVSDDMYNWQHVPVQPDNIGDAPTVAEFHDTFYLTANQSDLYRSASPLGPFESMGPFRTPDGQPLRVNDPMIFVDGERVYLYWGLADPGIFGAELCPDDLSQLITEPKILIAYDPDHEWERFGEWNQELGRSSIEGSWMFRHNGRYYLTYVGPGTCYATYSMGAYVSDQGPLEGFVYQKRNPILHNTHGMMKGPGHGCIIEAKDGTLWAFYTTILCFMNRFERRIGVDPAGIDENGEIYVCGSTDTPQWMPGVCEHPELGNDAGLKPLTFNNPTTATSHAPGREPIYATDDTLLDWWQPAADDPDKALNVELRGGYNVSAVRVLFRDVGLKYDAGRLPGPFRYLVECQNKPEDPWVTVVDRSNNQQDLCCDYEQFDPQPAQRVRLRLLNSPEGIEPGVINFTAFGTYLYRTEGV